MLRIVELAVASAASIVETALPSSTRLLGPVAVVTTSVRLTATAEAVASKVAADRRGRWAGPL